MTFRILPDISDVSAAAKMDEPYSSSDSYDCIKGFQGHGYLIRHSSSADRRGTILYALVAMSGQTDTISNPHSYTPEPYDIEKPDLRDAAEDGPFGSEENAEIKYRTLAWWYALPMQP